MIPSPIMTAMRKGEMGRFEELTRCTSDVQDALISILSEKYISVPELSGGDGIAFARPGFNIIATANSRDRGGQRPVHRTQEAVQFRADSDRDEQEDREGDRAFPHQGTAGPQPLRGRCPARPARHPAPDVRRHARGVRRGVLG